MAAIHQGPKTKFLPLLKKRKKKSIILQTLLLYQVILYICFVLKKEKPVTGVPLTVMLFSFPVIHE